MAIEILDASNEFPIQGYEHLLPFLITYWTYRESSFKDTAIDHQGSYGVGQIQGVLRKRCEDLGINLDTRKNQFRCVASSFQFLVERCGGFEKGLANYASSKCDLKGRPKWVVKSRLRKLRNLMEKVDLEYQRQLTDKKDQEDHQTGSGVSAE